MTVTTIDDQLEKIRTEPGFIAPLDQNGGSNPKAIVNHGIGAEVYSNYEATVGVGRYSMDRLGGPGKADSGFLRRLFNSMRALPGGNRPAGETVFHDFQIALDNLAKSAQAILQKPQLANRALNADIRLKNAEAMEKEALARKILVDSLIMEQQLDSKKRSDS